MRQDPKQQRAGRALMHEQLRMKGEPNTSTAITARQEARQEG
jgi:hypothetical protein